MTQSAHVNTAQRVLLGFAIFFIVLMGVVGFTADMRGENETIAGLDQGQLGWVVVILIGVASLFAFLASRRG